MYCYHANLHFSLDASLICTKAMHQMVDIVFVSKICFFLKHCYHCLRYSTNPHMRSLQYLILGMKICIMFIVSSNNEAWLHRPLTFQILRGLFHPACLARAASWLAFVVAIFMGHENSDNKGQRIDRTCKECWIKQAL